MQSSSHHFDLPYEPILLDDLTAEHLPFDHQQKAHDGQVGNEEENGDCDGEFLEDVELGRLGDQVHEVLLEEEGVDGRHHAQSALEAEGNEGDEEVDVGSQRSLPAAGKHRCRVNAGQASPSSRNEVDQCLAVHDEVVEVERVTSRHRQAIKRFVRVVPDVEVLDAS